MSKEILIIDAFITNEINEKKLSDFVDRVKEIKIPILLVSNSVINDEIVSKVDYYLYDSNNRLFGDIFEEYENFILYETLNGIRFNTVHKHEQKHALSVLVNLFNSLSLAKSLGFEYFHRIEYDTVLGNDTINSIKSIYNEVLKEEKKGYFILNPPNKTQKFQYFSCTIEDFYNLVPTIKNQYDYLGLLENLYDSRKFVHVERVMYDLIVGKEFLKITDKDGEEFNDSIWNTESSYSHLEEKYKRCRTVLYRGEEKDIILSKNNTNNFIKRNINLYKEDKLINTIIHELNGLNHYIFHSIEKDINRIEVIENNLVIDVIDPKKEKHFYKNEL